MAAVQQKKRPQPGMPERLGPRPDFFPDPPLTNNPITVYI